MINRSTREEILCDDLALGRIGISYLSLHVALYPRDPALLPQFRVRCGPTTPELLVQIYVRNYRRNRSPSKYLTGFYWPDKPCWVDTITLEHRVQREDLRRLASISAEYNQGLTPRKSGTYLKILSHDIEMHIRELILRLKGQNVVLNRVS